MGFRQDVLEQAELVQQVRGARLEHLATELAVERLVPFEDKDVGAALGEQQAQHEPGRAAADDAGVHAMGGHDALLA